MATFIQISEIAYDDIEDEAELEILQSLSGDEEAGCFVEIADGDETKTRRTTLNPNCNEVYTAEELIDYIEDNLQECTVIVDPSIDGISDYLLEAGFEKIDSYWAHQDKYRR